MIQRYTLPRMGSQWSDEARFNTMLEVELAITEGWAELGKIDKAVAARMRQNARFTVDAILEREIITRHDVAAFVSVVQESLGDDGRWFHYGVTSSDVVDTALAMQCVAAANLLLEDLDGLLVVVEKLAREHAFTPITGRTHGVHAEPTTFGLKCLVWYTELQRQKRRIASARDEMRVGKISGAVGTFATLDPSLEAFVCRRLGLEPAPVSTQILQRDRHAAFLSAMANLGGTLDKIAIEFRHLQRTEVLEAQEGFSKGQKGSSAMPHKRNPVNFEQICGLSRLLRSYAQAGFEDQALWHERDISHSSVERVVLPDATILADYMLVRMTKLLNEVVIFPDRMLRNLDAMKGLLYSQRVLLKLIDSGMSRDEAYVVVQSAAAEVWEKDRSFQEALKERVDMDLSELFKVDDYLRWVPQIFERCNLPLASSVR